MENYVNDTVKAYAKINLCLSVGDIAPCGKHNLDTLMMQIGIYDDVVIKKSDDKNIIVSYDDGIEIENDNVKVACQMLMERYGTNGVIVNIKKRIPIGAGLGGSSADMATVIKAMSKLYSIAVDDEFLISLGSDVPYMYYGGNKRVKGVGEKLYDVKLPRIKGVVAWKDNLSSLTKDVFATYDAIGGNNGSVDEFIAGNMQTPFNALEKSAIKLLPQILEIRRTLEGLGFKNVVMSGSGSAYIGYNVDKDIIDKNTLDEVFDKSRIKYAIFSSEGE